MSTSRPRTRPDPLAYLRHLTPRDRVLLAWLAEHQVLTTNQIAEALFPSLRAAQKRLTLLYGIRAVDRFIWAPAPTETASGYRYTLGPLGDLLHPSGRGRRSLLSWRAELARSPKLPHLLGVNTFFIALAGYSRTHPGHQLARWWSEREATAVYTLAGIHPDGHGIWYSPNATVGFFLEHDRGTETIATVMAKLPAYQRLTVAGPRYPVLLHVPGPSREARLHRWLREWPPGIPVATTTHGRHPAEAVWAMVGHGGARLRLDELPSDHGPAGPDNLHRFEP